MPDTQSSNSNPYPRKRTIWEVEPEYEVKDWRLKKLKVAAYIRVSTDSEDQLNSFENQRNRYEDFIKQYPNWEFVGIYADEGISGTSTNKRDEFNRMVNDCKEGKIDLVVVKDVSRFARNTLDCLNTTRELLRLTPPVGVYFDSNGINTLDVGNEVFLTIFAMFAQMDSELKSDSVKKGLDQNYKKGKYLCPTYNLLGYTKERKYTMTVEPKGAKAVQLIYKMFLSGITLQEIADTMMSIGVPTGGDMLKWTTQTVRSILSNERYCGDILISKSYIQDIFTHKVIKNTGKKRMMYEEGHHEPIISREAYTRALLLLKANYRSPYFNLHYEARIIRKGLLSGFIPLNIAFGGYDAGNYLAAALNAEIPEMQFDDALLKIPKTVSGEMFDSNETEYLTMTKNAILWSRKCVEFYGDRPVEFLLHPQERLLAIRKTTENNPNAIKLENKFTSSSVNKAIYDLMGWRRDYKHRIIADIFERDSNSVMFFNLNNSAFCINSKRLLPEDWLSELDEPRSKKMLFTRLLLSQNLKDWRINAKATSIRDFNTDVAETDVAERETLKKELEKEYVDWEPTPKRKNKDR